MKKIKLILSAAAVLFGCVLAMAQNNIKISGSVLDQGGNPLQGAAVFVQGTTHGASTDFEGNYSLSAPSNGSLVVSIIGYKEQVVAINGRKTINFILEEDSEVLEDVVVVAYGTAKREALTGSVSAVKGETLASAPVTSVEGILQGKLAGVSISTNNGAPGANNYIRIRGNGSINAANAPLWVIDGIPVITGPMSELGNSNTSSSLTGLNPNDIESITVLKDAAAAAAYGSRAANGVILVTTKSGKEGQASFSARAKFGVNWLKNDSGFRVMNAKELLTWQRDAITNAGMDPDDPTGNYYRPWSILNGPIYNALEDFIRIGNIQEYELSARGGNSRSKFFSSFSYQKSEGVFYGVDFQKLHGRVNTSYKLLDNLEMGVRLNLAYTKSADVPMQGLQNANPLYAGMSWIPWEPTKDADGNFISNPNVNSGENPRATSIYDDQYDTMWHLNGIVNLRWSPIKNLDIETKNSIETFFVGGRLYMAPGAHEEAYAYQLEEHKKEIVQLTTSNTITYGNIFGGYHNVHAVVGQEATTYDSKNYLMYSPSADDSMPFFLSSLDQSLTEVQYGESSESMLSFFGIADYNYDNRYFAQANIRTDGSSLFGADNKWGIFGSVSASWNATNEKFMKGIKWLDLLKIRISYGVNGNNGIDPYKAYGLYGSGIYNGINGYLPSQLENRVLSWERNKTWNIGLDFGLFKNRLNGSIDVYNRKTVDLLLTKQIPQTSGFSTIFTNVGSMQNAGIELQLNYDIISKPDMLWSIGGNLAHNKTTILDLGGDEHLGTYVRQTVGRGMYSYYLYDYYGVNPSNGEPLWVAEDGSLTNEFSKARQYYAGSPEPKISGGFNTTFQWKGLAFSAFFEFKAGHQVWNYNEYYYNHNDGMDFSSNQMASALNYWKKPGDTGCNPKPIAGNTTNSNNRYNDRWLQNADFLRVKDVTLSYTLPQKWTKKAHMNSVKVYVSGLNLYCFNSVNMWDPEQGVSGYTAGAYPLTKSVVGGLEITF